MSGEKAQNQKLIEYEVLSEDRRRAVEIFLKGFLIAVGIMAFGFKLLIDAKDILSLIIIGSGGLLIGIIGALYLYKCRQHDLAIFNRLNEIAKMCDFSLVISTQYIFNVAGFVSLIIGSAWISVVIIMIIKLRT